MKKRKYGSQGRKGGRKEGRKEARKERRKERRKLRNEGWKKAKEAKEGS